MDTRSNKTGPTMAWGSPSWWGSMIGMLVGVATVCLAVSLAVRGASTPVVLDIALGIAGVLEFVVSLAALRGSRSGWSFSLSLNGTGFVVTLFSAPKIRDAAELPIAAALLPCVVLGLITLLHALVAEN